MTRCFASAALFTGTLLLTIPTLAQTAPSAPAARPGAAPSVQTTVQPKPADPAVEAQRRAAEERLRRRDESMRRLVRGICRGC